MSGKRPGKICPIGKERPPGLRVAAGRPEKHELSQWLVGTAGWHAIRKGWIRSELIIGEQYDEDDCDRARRGGDLVWGFDLCRSACERDVTYQGPRQYRGRAPESADRLRPSRRPQWHRRYAEQYSLHQAIAPSHAGAARRQH